MKLKIISLISLVSSIFILASCGTKTDPYKDIVKDSDALKLTGNIKTEYDVSNGALPIDRNDLKVYYPEGTEIPYLDTDESSIPQNKYFFTLSNITPTLSRIKASGKMSTSKNKYSQNIYVALINSNNQVHVSKQIIVTLTNSKALNPVLYYVGGGAIIVIVAAIIFFAKKYKQTH